MTLNLIVQNCCKLFKYANILKFASGAKKFGIFTIGANVPFYWRLGMCQEYQLYQNVPKCESRKVSSLVVVACTNCTKLYQLYQILLPGGGCLYQGGISLPSQPAPEAVSSLQSELRRGGGGNYKTCSPNPSHTVCLSPHCTEQPVSLHSPLCVLLSRYPCLRTVALDMQACATLQNTDE